jgi:hypothetical protein
VVVNDRLVSGHRFAHRITQHELVAGWIDVVPDFAAIAAFARHYVTASGDEIDVTEPAEDERSPGRPAGLVLRGPDGWLDGGSADATAVISLDGSTLTMTWEPPTPALAVDPSPIAAVFERLGHGQPVPLLDLVLHLLIDDPTIGTVEPLVPMQDRLDAAGLVVDGITVRRANRGAAARASGPAGVPGVGLGSALAAEHLLAAVVAVVQQTPVDLNLVAPALADPIAVAAMAEQVVGGALVTPDQFELLLEGVATASTLTGMAAGGLAFLRSRLAEWRGDAAAQEHHLLEALNSGHYPGALVDAAEFAADRGDARGALASLRTGGVPADDPDAVLLARYTATGPRMVGRNDLCWCGSGRKHKQCCLPLNGWDLDSRAQWLHAKAITFLQRPPQRATLFAVAMAHAGTATLDEAPARVIAAACDTTVTELCLFEGGIFGRFLEVRGALLPNEERELAEQWRPARHRLWEVAGGGVLRDRSDGTERTVDAASTAKLPAAGLVLAVVHDGPLAIPGTALPIRGHAVDALAELLETGDATAIAAHVGREFGWTAAPDLGSEPDHESEALTTTP